MTNLDAAVAQLKQERGKLDRAIAALSGDRNNSAVEGGAGFQRPPARESPERKRRRWATFKKNKAR